MYKIIEKNAAAIIDKKCTINFENRTNVYIIFKKKKVEPIKMYLYKV